MSRSTIIRCDAVMHELGRPIGTCAATTTDALASGWSLGALDYCPRHQRVAS